LGHKTVLTHSLTHSLTVKLFLKYSNLCDDDTSTSQTDNRTDGRMTCCIAWHGKS